MDIVKLAEQAGVVGAGGAGFPTHVKLNCKAELVIANGAECEPLLRVDQTLMQTQPHRVVEGLLAAMETVGAGHGVIATKAHYHGAVDALKEAVASHPQIGLHLMKSFYPAGDEKTLIQDITGRTLPSGRLPADLGCVVLNVGTLINLSHGMEGRPVTDKTLTVGGAVEHPVTLDVPVGTPIQTVLRQVGFTGDSNSHALIMGGPCMGALEENWEAPVTKTTGGILVLPASHLLVARRRAMLQSQLKLAKAVCCQCSLCTQLCPRNALGLGVSPHKIMRAMACEDASLLGDVNSLLACCSCTLCTDYACNFGLTPGAMMTEYKNRLLKGGVKPVPEENILPDEGMALKRVPTRRLMARMGLSEYDRPAPLLEKSLEVGRVRIPLRMHIGKPSWPVVAPGDPVVRGQLIAAIPQGELGAAVHASIEGTVSKVTRSYIEIKA